MNKKLIISLSIIGAVAAVAIGATVAYFNDVETSTGNIFTAGTMDLKVDHKYAMYDGNECLENCVEDTNTDLIQNGSFEVPEVTDSAKWETFVNGSADLAWTVEWESTQTTYVYNGQTYNRPTAALVEYQEGVNGWTTPYGDQWTELDSDWFGPSSPVSGEPALVKIYQNVPTTPGTQYKLHYWFSARPANGGGGNGTADNELKVRIDGNKVADRTLSNGTNQTVWNEYVETFTATNVTTKVEFAAAGTANSLGIFLDNVSLHPMTCTYQITGGTCTLWTEKDLGAGDYYWHFGDVKPGDYGTNIISMHVYNNDAYACLIAHNLQDIENNVLDPEITAGDDVASTTGELSQFLTAFVWVDSNQNNTYDNGEDILYGPNAPLTNINTMTRIPLTATTTAYVGVAWCFGTQTVDGSGIHCSGTGNQDIAQTDSFQSYFTVYAEQQRNNENFSCAVLTASLDKSSPQLFKAQ